ncbi:helix-turn-helix domain-containing protein [Clostridium perfringens]|uniref:helix-turn-helix domain-containing protein n=1 Tax=Clostridium perfringens TaxID=1502 RepID=UPI000D71977F|nr:helix-turn-helix domain-containing protein [Clostridium perfringens]MBO3323473.1 helix-turn-helix domain-containing protein [Clostridium perfringens]MBO3332615.1 helix-turn-helix domain-containing protein [Clostridium perfringens]
MANKEVSKNYYNIPSKLSNDELLVYYRLCENANFTLEEFRDKKRFECFGSKRTLSEDTGLGDKKVLVSLKNLEEKGYIELIKKGKPPKTPSKYKLVYAEKIKNREPFESVENTSFKGEREPLNEQEPLKEPLREPFKEPFESVENKGVKRECEPLEEPLKEPLKEPPSKDISKDNSKDINNIYSPLENELYYDEVNKNLEKDLIKRINSKYPKDIIKEEFEKLKYKGFSELDLLKELDKNLKSKSKDNSNQDIEEIWSLYPLKKGKANAIKKIPKLLKEHGKEQIIRCIERYVEEIKKENKSKEFILHGSTFFNGRYMDYLDCNYQEDITTKSKEEPKRRGTNLDDL